MKNIVLLLLLGVVAFACSFETTGEEDIYYTILDLFRSLSFWLGISLIVLSIFIKKYKKLLFWTGYCITIAAGTVYILFVIDFHTAHSFLYYIDKFDGVVNLFKHLFSK